MASAGIMGGPRVSPGTLSGDKGGRYRDAGSGSAEMPDPALEIMGEFFALVAGLAEQSGELLTDRLGLVPELFRLGTHRLLQGLEDFLFQPLGSQDGDRQGGKAQGADRDIGGLGRPAGG